MPESDRPGKGDRHFEVDLGSDGNRQDSTTSTWIGRLHWRRSLAGARTAKRSLALGRQDGCEIDRVRLDHEVRTLETLDQQVRLEGIKRVNARCGGVRGWCEGEATSNADAYPVHFSCISRHTISNYRGDPTGTASSVSVDGAQRVSRFLSESRRSAPRCIQAMPWLRAATIMVVLRPTQLGVGGLRDRHLCRGSSQDAAPETGSRQFNPSVGKKREPKN